MAPALADRVFRYTGETPLFEALDINRQIKEALKREVSLPSGGYIVIDSTEALTAIDVNTGKYVGDKSLEETVLRTNIEAVSEVVRQLRLRDIGGIIVIDFIDMARDAHRSLVMRELEEHLRRDRTRSAVLGITHLGLVEVTRRKRRQSLPELLTRTCPACGGSGRVITETAAGRQARRQLRKLARETQSEAFLVEAHPSVAAVLIGPGGSHLRELERETGKSIFVRGSEACQVGELRLVAQGSRQDMLAQALPVQAGQVLELRVEEPTFPTAKTASPGWRATSSTSRGRPAGWARRSRWRSPRPSAPTPRPGSWCERRLLSPPPVSVRTLHNGPVAKTRTPSRNIS